MKIFAERLRELREQNELSMCALAEKIGVSDAAICKWENGTNEPKASYILLLSNFFGVSTDYLLGLEDDATLNLSFTDEDKAAGIKNYGTKLSNSEWEVLELFSELKRTKGPKVVKAVITMLKALIESEN